MRFLFLFVVLSVSASISANTLQIGEPERMMNVAKPEKADVPTLSLITNDNQTVEYTEAELTADPQLTVQLLNHALYAHRVEFIEMLLNIYQRFPNTDPILVLYAKGKIAFLKKDYPSSIAYYRTILAENPEFNPVRIELAQVLYYDKQNASAEELFLKAQRADDLPEPINRLIESYLNALKKRDEWNIELGGHYVRETNVNSTSDTRHIENTGFIKHDNMMPQSAHGIAYHLGISKETNLWQRYYLVFSNQLFGKSYWDNHDYDDILNRTTLGYRYKTSMGSFGVLPFYEKRWYGGQSYRWNNGIRLELSHIFSPFWQISFAGEYSKQHYFDAYALNGINKLISTTLIWTKKPTQFFYLGADFNRETAAVKQFSSDTRAVRLGWIQEWSIAGISSRVNFSFAQRDYKDTAVLGGLINLGKTRKDDIYTLHTTLWKRDWHWLKITPKLQLTWRKQKSNLPTLYSYTEKHLNLLFERSF